MLFGPTLVERDVPGRARGLLSPAPGRCSELAPGIFPLVGEKATGFVSRQLHPDGLQLGILLVGPDGFVPAEETGLLEPAKGRGDVTFGEAVLHFRIFQFHVRWLVCVI